MKEQNKQTSQVCPCCGRHCDLSAPGCQRGEEYLRTGQLPEGGGPGHVHQGHHEHHPEMKERGHHRHDRCNRKGGDILETERYAAMDISGKLEALLRELGHMGRFRMEGKGGQNRILHILAAEGTMTQRALTERIGVQSGSASEILGKLERAGLIQRRASELDRRTVDVTLTDAGREQARRQAQEHSARKAAMFASLSPEEQKTLLNLLEKVLRDWSSRAAQKTGEKRREK